MSLDAYVFCNCFESGNLISQPKSNWQVFVDKSGCLYSAEKPRDPKFDQWSFSSACIHEGGIHTSYFLGNMAMISAIRSMLSPICADIPIIMQEIIYNGIHCGDFIHTEKNKPLLTELGIIEKLKFSRSEEQAIISDFVSKLKELTNLSIFLNKPINF